MAITIKAEQRNITSKGSLRKLRAAGQIPAIVYGKQIQGAQAVSVSEKDISSMLRTQPNAVITLDIPGTGNHAVMITDVQKAVLSGHMMHIDFHQISMNEKVRMLARIELTGESIGVSEGGISQVILHELEIQCLPSDIPEYITADISNLAIGESLHVSDLFMPNGVEAKTDPTAVVVTILAPQKDVEPEEEEESTSPNQSEEQVTAE